MLHAFLQALIWTVVSLALVCALLHLFPRLGTVGKRISQWLCYAPGLDVVITLLTTAPLIVGPAVWGWMGLLGAIVGQYIVLLGWTAVHELVNLDSHKGPRMYRVHNRLIGFGRNMAALLVTSAAVPTFIVIRLTEWLVYPGLVVVANLPPYKQREWVNVTRHKFSGLVGHDRIWCLYCDWMTGVWSLGSEMLRNVESFWCPIQFGDTTKCENCRHDFPDVHGGWVAPSAGIGAAVRVLEEQYENHPRPPSNAWFGHPVRLTVRGRPASGTPNEPTEPVHPAARSPHED